MFRIIIINVIRIFRIIIIIIRIFRISIIIIRIYRIIIIYYYPFGKYYIPSSV